MTERISPGQMSLELSSEQQTVTFSEELLMQLRKPARELLTLEEQEDLRRFTIEVYEARIKAENDALYMPLA